MWAEKPAAYITSSDAGNGGSIKPICTTPWSSRVSDGQYVHGGAQTVQHAGFSPHLNRDLAMTPNDFPRLQHSYPHATVQAVDSVRAVQPAHHIPGQSFTDVLQALEQSSATAALRTGLTHEQFARLLSTLRPAPAWATSASSLDGRAGTASGKDLCTFTSDTHTSIYTGGHSYALPFLDGQSRAPDSSDMAMSGGAAFSEASMQSSMPAFTSSQSQDLVPQMPSSRLNGPAHEYRGASELFFSDQRASFPAQISGQMPMRSASMSGMEALDVGRGDRGLGSDVVAKRQRFETSSSIAALPLPISTEQFQFLQGQQSISSMNDIASAAITLPTTSAPSHTAHGNLSYAPSAADRKLFRRLKHRQVETDRRQRLKRHFEELKQLITASAPQLLSPKMLRGQSGGRTEPELNQDEVLVAAIRLIQKFRAVLDAPRDECG